MLAKTSVAPNRPAASRFELCRVDDQHVVGSGVPGALHGVHPDAAQTDDEDHVPGSDLAGVHRASPAGGHPAGHETGHVQRDVFREFHRLRLVTDEVVRECAQPAGATGPRAVGQVEAVRAIHGAPGLHARPVVADVLLPAGAVPTLAARRDEQRADVVAHLHPPHPGADCDDDTCALVTAHQRQVDREVAGDIVIIAVAQAGGDDLHQDLVGVRLPDVDVLDAPLLAECVDDRCSRLHDGSLVQEVVVGGSKGRAPRTWRRVSARAGRPAARSRRRSKQRRRTSARCRRGSPRAPDRCGRRRRRAARAP